MHSSNLKFWAKTASCLVFFMSWRFWVWFFFVKAELLQEVFFSHPFICQRCFSNEKVGNQKNWAHFYYISFKSWIQWIFDLRKFLGTAKNFLKSKIFLKSNILKQWNIQVLAGYQTPAQKIELFSCSIALLFLFRMLSHENKQCFLNIS